MTMIDATNDLRKALIRHTVTTVMHGTAEMKHWLAETLLLSPFEMMSTDQLEALAREVIQDADVDLLVETKSTELYEETGNRYLCGQCLDVGMILDVGANGWRRCMRCNPGTLLAQLVGPAAEEF